MKHLAPLFVLFLSACAFQPSINSTGSVRDNIFEYEGLPSVRVSQSIEYIGKHDHVRDGRGRRKANAVCHAFIDRTYSRGVAIVVESTAGWFNDTKFDIEYSLDYEKVKFGGKTFERITRFCKPSGIVAWFFKKKSIHYPVDCLCRQYRYVSPMKNHVADIMYFEEVYYAGDIKPDPDFEIGWDFGDFNNRADEAIKFLE